MNRITVGRAVSTFWMTVLILTLHNHPSPAGEFSTNSVQSRKAMVPAMLDPNPNYNNIRPEKTLLELSAAPPTSIIAINYLPQGQDPYGIGDSCIAWPPEAKSAFDAAASLWASKLTSPVPITIDACWANNLSSPYGTVLGHGGPLVVFYNNSGDTLYPSALTNALAGYKLLPGKSDIFIGCNSSIPWYFGTDGNPPPSQVDLVTVIAQEIAHGLGFIGSMQVLSGFGYWGDWGYFDEDPPFIYDRFTVDGAGHSLINTAIFPNPSIELGNALTGGAVFFNGGHAKAANGGIPAKLYAPSLWQPGSSYGHLDYATYANTQNALMIPYLSSGRAIHDQGPVTMGLLMDLGWNTQGDSLPPQIIATTPSNGATGVPAEVSLTATFSEAINQSTVSATTFTLKNGSTPVAGSVSYNAATMIATFTPAAPLAANISYTATITRGVTDLFGNAMTSDKTWAFTTGTPGATTTNILDDPGFEYDSPSWTQYSSGSFELIYHDPILSHTGTGFALLGGYPNATERLVQQIPIPANASKVTSQFWYWIGTDEPGSTAFDTLKLIVFNPTTGAPLKVLATLSNANQSDGYVQSPLYDLTDYKGQTVGIGFEAKTNGTNDSAFLIDDVSLLVTVSDITPPTITSLSPPNGATGVWVSSPVTATFSENIDPATISTTSFTLKKGSSPVSGSVSYDAATKTAVFTPATTLSGGTLYTATITTGVKDSAGNPMTSNYSWSFTTQTIQYPLIINIAGTGTGTVTSTPEGITCTSGTCAAQFDANSQVSLTASPSSSSLFTGWSGACTNTTGNCILTMNTAKSVTAIFDVMPPVRIAGPPCTYFWSLANATAVVPTGETIQAQATVLTENVTLARAISVDFRGGYDSSYGSVVGRTILKGRLAISRGRLAVRHLAVR